MKLKQVASDRPASELRPLQRALSAAFIAAVLAAPVASTARTVHAPSAESWN